MNGLGSWQSRQPFFVRCCESGTKFEAFPSGKKHAASAKKLTPTGTEVVKGSMALASWKGQQVAPASRQWVGQAAGAGRAHG